MKALGLDIGDATIGLAFSDGLFLTAQPYQTYRRVSVKADVDYIVSLIVERSVDRVVAGLPMRLDGSEGPQAEKTRAFMKALEKKLKYSDRLDWAVGIDYIDERFTSREAENILKIGGLNRKERSKKEDEIAAALILQSFMDRQRNKE